MELKVYEKLLEWRRKGTAVSVGRLQEWSREFMKLLYPDKKWKGSQRWSERFRRRWNLSVRMKTRVAQKTAAHVAEQCKSFWQFVRAKRRERDINTAWIINADQTPLWLEMPATTTVEETGVRSVPIRSAGYQKQRVTVMLACTADGRKLKPWVFFKRKTLPKGDFPVDVAMACHENGWMDFPGVVRLLEEGVKPFLKPRFGRHAKSSMLVLDSYRSHLTEEVKEKLREMNCVPAIIPSGCTAEVQPLNVCINKSFKASVRQQYQRWFEVEGQEQRTAAVMPVGAPKLLLDVVTTGSSEKWVAVADARAAYLRHLLPAAMENLHVAQLRDIERYKQRQEAGGKGARAGVQEEEEVYLRRQQKHALDVGLSQQRWTVKEVKPSGVINLEDGKGKHMANHVTNVARIRFVI
ncbi:unnamed protein product [Closterium sp. NIES-53]